MNDNSSTGQDVANEGVPLEENVGAESESIEDSGQQTLSVELQEVIQETQDFRKKQRGKKIVWMVICLVIAVALCVSAVIIASKYHKLKAEAVAFSDKITALEGTTYNLGTLEDLEAEYTALTDYQKKFVPNYESFTLMKYEFTLKNMAKSINNSFESSMAACSIVTGAWHNAIYKEYDEYNKGDYSDFNDALKEAMNSQVYKMYTASITVYNKLIDENFPKLKNPPSQYQSEYDAIKELYAAYTPLAELALSPKGSYKSVTEDVNTYKNAYKAKAATMKTLNPTIFEDK